MRRLIRVVLGIWLLMAVLLAAVLIAGRILSGRSEMIAFQSGRMADMNIYLYDVQTGVTHNLTRQPGRTQTLHVMSDSDMAEYPTEPQHFVSQGSDVSPAWSPDGRQLAFVSWRDGNSEIYLLDLRSGQLRNLTNYPGADSSPVWSPDGTRIAFESLRGGYWNIRVIDLETGAVRDLTDGVIASQSPAWSPDGRHIAFQSRREGYWDLYMIDLESGEMRNLTNSTSDDLNPVWTAARP
jgi:Tol biopolymer transport system component